MADYISQPCNEGVVRAGKHDGAHKENARTWVLAATILGTSLASITTSAVNVALPNLQSALDTTLINAQWVVNAYTLFLAALILLGGSLGDRYGRKRIYVVGTVIFGAASVWCALSPGVAQLIAARAVQGVGAALLTPGSLAIISAAFPEGERGKAIGLWSGFTAITTAAGPVLGGFVTDALSWRWVFWMVVPLAVLVVLITLWRVPESRDDEVTGGLDYWGALLATLGLAGLTFGLLHSSNTSWVDPLVLGSLALGVACLGAFVWIEGRVSGPMMPLKLFRSSTFAGANLLTLLLYAALGAALFFLPYHFQRVQGYSATTTGLALLPMIVLMTLLARWAGGLVDRVGARLPLVVGPSVVAVGFALLALPGINANYWLTFFPALLTLGLGLAVSVAPLTTTVMNAVPTHQAGTASGINNAAARLANLLAVAVFGVVILLVFNPSLSGRLEPLALPQSAAETLLAERGELANMNVPEGLPEATQEGVEAAIQGAFVQGFRFVTLVCAGLAAASAGTAFFTIKDTRKDDESMGKDASKDGSKVKAKAGSKNKAKGAGEKRPKA